MIFSHERQKAHIKKLAQGFEIMMPACRSAVARSKIRLPLGPGETELEALERALP